MTNELKPFLEDMLSMSTGTDGRTLQIHFSRPVTMDDRLSMMNAHNAAVTRATPSADPLAGLQRYRLHWHDFDTADMETDSEGEYVLYSEAAKIIAALKAENHDMRQDRDRALEWRDHDKERAETAEAELAQIKAQGGGE